MCEFYGVYRNLLSIRQTNMKINRCTNEIVRKIKEDKNKTYGLNLRKKHQYIDSFFFFKQNVIKLYKIFVA